MRYFVIDTDPDNRYRKFCNDRLDNTDNPDTADRFLVFGGDGAILNAINRFHVLGKPFIGVNTGTRGYLMNNLENPFHFVELLSEIRLYEFWMLEAEVETVTKTLRVHGFNDIWVERQSGQTLRMKMTIDGVKQPPMLVGDGVLFSTPQGSTGYNRSLRGKPISPRVPVLQVTPMSCVVNKSPLGSIILSDTSEVIVDFLQIEKRPGSLSYDGFQRKNDPVRRITVRKGKNMVKLGLIDQYSFMNKVLSWQLNY